MQTNLHRGKSAAGSERSPVTGKPTGYSATGPDSSERNLVTASPLHGYFFQSSAAEIPSRSREISSPEEEEEKE